MSREVEALVQQYQVGNWRAYEELMKRFEPLMYKMAQTYSIPYMDEQDVVQEARYVLYQVLQKYQTGTSNNFPAYYKRSLRNYIFSYLRREFSGRRVPVTMQVSQDEEKYAYLKERNTAVSYLYQASADTVMTVKEELQQYMKQLSTFEKKVLGNYIKGKSFDDTATKERCSREKVTRAFNRCRRKLRSSLSGQS